MRKLLLLCFLAVALFASNILNNNIYESDDHVDMVLLLDAPYAGKVVQKKDKDGIALTFEGLNISNPIDKVINSPVIQQVLVNQKSVNETIVYLKSDQIFNISVSKTTDNFGLRIRASIKTSPLGVEDMSNDSQVEMVSQSDFGTAFYIFTSIVFTAILIFIALWIKQNFFNGNKKTFINTNTSWIFGDIEKNPEITVMFKKYIDNENYILLFEFLDERYLVLLGQSNLLLEKFQGNESKNIKFFDENGDKTNMNVQLNEEKLQSYKDKASAE
ncbi:MAG: hypothetical protein ACK5LP_08555 [Campylobacteraceae bacterium]